MRISLYVLVLFPLFSFHIFANNCLKQIDCSRGEACKGFKCVSQINLCQEDYQCSVGVDCELRKNICSNQDKKFDALAFKLSTTN
jgi:hypothetical protein